LSKAKIGSELTALIPPPGILTVRNAVLPLYKWYFESLTQPHGFGHHWPDCGHGERRTANIVQYVLGSGPNSNESARSSDEAKEASGRSAGHAEHIQAKTTPHISPRLATLRAGWVCLPGALRSLENQPDFRRSRACQTTKPNLSWTHCY